MTLRDALRRPRSGRILLATAAVLLAFFTFLDLREGGLETTVLTTRLATPAFYVETFGAGFVYGSVILNLALALAIGTLVAVTVGNYHEARATAGAACSASASVVLGVAVFGCPGCVLPIAGTFGLTFFATSLPLLGLEFKVLSLLMVLVTVAWVVRRAGSSRPQEAGEIDAVA